MGGAGSGGTRIGSGGKPRSPGARWLRGRPGSTRPGATSPIDVPEAPADLTDRERPIWATLAPAAALAGTLTAATACDFRSLIELLAEGEELLVARRAAGWGDAGRALASAYRQTILRAEAKLRGFALSPIGKPMPGAVPISDPEEDAFAEFDQPPVLPGRSSQ